MRKRLGAVVLYLLSVLLLNKRSQLPLQKRAMGTCIKARSNTRNISTQSIAALVCTTCFLRLATQLHRVAIFWMKPNVWSLLCATMLQFEISVQVVSIPITSSIENLIRNFSIRQIDELRQFATTHVLGG